MNEGPLRDSATVDDKGERLDPLPDGVQLRDSMVQVDDRGMLCEMADQRWPEFSDPIVYSYFVTIRPNVVKGWIHHRTYSDRLFQVSGVVDWFLYDDRQDSRTRGLLAKVNLSEHRRRLLVIPPFVWHAAHNVGVGEALFINFPTRPYDRDNPDKYRLPLNNDLIPHRFENTRGW